MGAGYGGTLRDYDVEQIGVCGSTPLEGSGLRSEDEARQAAVVLRSPWSRGRTARRRPDRRFQPGIGVRDYVVPGHDAVDLVLAGRPLAAGP